MFLTKNIVLIVAIALSTVAVQASQTSTPRLYGLTTPAFMSEMAQKIEDEDYAAITDTFAEMVRQGGLWRVHCNMLREREVCERIPYQPGDPR